MPETLRMDTIEQERVEELRSRAVGEPGPAEPLPEPADDERLLPEQLVFTEQEVGARGTHRRYRQRALGVHAGHLTLRRENPVLLRRYELGSEYYLG